MQVVKQGIYEIRNTESGAVYVGQSVDTEKRMQDHRHALVRDRHINRYLQEDWNAYGEAAFTFEHVETVYREAFLLPKERERIDGYVAAEIKLYNVAGVRRGKTWRKLKKTVLFNPFQHYRRRPLVLRYLTFKDKPALPEQVVDEPLLPEVIVSKPLSGEVIDKPVTEKAKKRKAKKKEVELCGVVSASSRYPIKPPKIERGCPHHPGVVCWHMAHYGAVDKQYIGMTFKEYDEARRAVLV